jgi:hypothetical protein
MAADHTADVNAAISAQVPRDAMIPRDHYR